MPPEPPISVPSAIFSSRWTALCSGVAYFAFAWLSHTLSPPEAPFVTFWLPSGLYLATLLLSPTRRWAWVVTAVVAANLLFDHLNGQPLRALPGFSLANTAEALIAAVLVRRFVGPSPQFNHLATTLRFALLVGLVAPAVGATIGTANVSLTLGATNAIRTWLMWWTGDATGLLLLAPLLLLWSRARWANRHSVTASYLGGIAVATACTALLARVAIDTELDFGVGLKYLALPLVGFTALRFGPRSGLGATLVVGIVFAMRTTGRVDPVDPSLSIHLARILSLQCYLLVLCLSTLALGALLEERRLHETALSKSEAFRKRLFESSSVPIVVMDPATAAIIDCNPAAVTIYGFANRTDAVGKTVEEASAPLQYDGTPSPMKARQHIERVLATGSDTFEWRHRRPNGELWDAEVHLVSFESGGRTLLQFTLQDITKRKSADEALRRSDTRMRLATEATGVAVWEWNSATNELEWDESMYRICGLRREDFTNAIQAWNACLHPDDRPLVERNVQSDLRGEQDHSSEFRIIRPDGSIRFIATTACVFRAPDGAPLRLLGTNIDITARKRAEEALFRSEVLFRRMFDEAPIAAALLDPRGVFQRANAAACRFLGYTADELCRLTFADITHPDDLATSRAAVDRLLAGTAPSFDLEKRYRRKDGSIVWGRVSVALLRDEEGRPLYLAPIIQDITARKQTEEQLRESELRYRTLADSGQALIWTAGLDKKCDYFNQPWLDFTGRSLAQELGDGWIEGVHPEDLDRCVATYAAAFERRERFSMDYRIRHRDGTYRWIQDNGSPRFDSHGAFLGYIGHCLDITDRRRAEEELRKKTALLEAQLDSTLDGLLVVDEQGRKLLQNRRMAALWKIPPEIAHSPDDQSQIDYVTTKIRDPEKFAAQIAHLYRHPGETSRDEIELQDGSILERYSAPVVGPESKYYGRIWTFRDITDRKRAEQALRESELQHRLLIQHLNAGVVVHAPDTRVLLSNDQASALLGLTPEQMLGKVAIDPAWTFLREDGTALPPDEYPVNQVRASSRPIRNQVFGIRPTTAAAPVWVLVNAFPHLGATGALHQIVVTFVDITKLKLAEGSLREMLREKESLLKEVHHRVKNNLQIISSLLRLQADQIGNPVTADVLRDMQGRIRSMALLHETLYRSGNLARIDLADYLEAVCTQLLRAHQRSAGTIALRLELVPVELDAVQAVPCGLLVNELVSNSFKHAFPAGRAGEVRLELRALPAPDAATGRKVRLAVTDNGVGLPADLDVQNLRSLGLQLVSDLARQLQGSLEIGPGPGGGAAFALVFTTAAADTAPPS